MANFRQNFIALTQTYALGVGRSLVLHLGNKGHPNAYALKQIPTTHAWLGSHLLIRSFQLRIFEFCLTATSFFITTLGFIKRTISDFKHTSSIIYLYRTLVLPLLTYCSTIWSPSQHTYIDKFEGIQRKLLRYLALKSGTLLSYTDHDYSNQYIRFRLLWIYKIHY